ncbi:LysM peptidoglycan-binding domain-containing protein [Cetobacterium sp.]|uniref:LysM peptidoglycan-binding domain-containing protein n=1 Tax=Cetobacterium sp. TaxID=2071632 RepID=UPI003F2F01A7
MYKLLSLFLIVSSLVLATENKNRLEFQLNNKNLEILEILITSDEEVGIYIIKKGDTLSKISREVNNTVNSLTKLNNINNKNLILIGVPLLYVIKGVK